MNSPISSKADVSSLRNSICRSPLWRAFSLVPLALVLACFVLPCVLQGADGGLPNLNTAEGDFALNAIATNSANPGARNTAIGYLSLYYNTSGYANVASGAQALYINSTGSYNTATGTFALLSNNGSYNTATGFQSGNDGNYNTATGYHALVSNTGNSNTATGSEALLSNQGGNGNTATGSGALYSNTNAGRNTANGFQSLYTNTTGGDNTATGFQALFSNSGGFSNTADGLQSLYSNTTGTGNTASGYQALSSNTTGANNTANGLVALENNTIGKNNTALGTVALFGNTTGSNNTAVGTNAGQNLTTGSNNIDIGANVLGAVAEANTIRIGKQGTQKSTLIAGIFGTAVSGSQVVVSSNGKLGVAPSSARFKEAIKPMDKASEAILALKPVTFRYKRELDPDGVPQFGLVAEEVEKINPDLVVRGEDGKVMTVRYEAVNAMLLNEFLKEHGQVQQLKATVAQQQKEIAAQQATAAQQQKQIEALTAGLQKVTAELQTHKPASRLVSDK
jgi:uncharacterized coiled-coil protein SlyX